jgi:hypothetical protein
LKNEDYEHLIEVILAMDRLDYLIKFGYNLTEELLSKETRNEALRKLISIDDQVRDRTRVLNLRRQSVHMDYLLDFLAFKDACDRRQIDLIGDMIERFVR